MQTVAAVIAMAAVAAVVVVNSKVFCCGCSSDSRVANVGTAAVAVAWSLQWFLPRLVVYSGFCDDCCSGGIDMYPLKGLVFGVTSMVAISVACVGCYGDCCSDFYSHCCGDCFSGN
jgi:hypothetical protein